MIRVVFDTVVFVRALINPFGRWGRLLFEPSSAYRLVISPPVVSEVLVVIRRPEVVVLFRPHPGRDSAAVLALLADAESVEIDEATIPRVSRDPKDDKFLATARAGRAAFLVSEDDDLLVLEEYEGIRIVNAETFLRVLDECAATGNTGS